MLLELKVSREGSSLECAFNPHKILFVQQLQTGKGVIWLDGADPYSTDISYDVLVEMVNKALKEADHE